MSGYIGVQPVPKATQRREYFTATNGQTSFSTSGYTPEYIDVYMNGVKLSPADFTATNGSDVVLGSGAATGDLLQIISFLPFSVLNQAFSGTLSVAGAVTANAGVNSTGTGTFGSLNVDTLNLNGSSLTASGNLTLDVAGDIILDSDGNDILLKDNGVTFGQLTNDSGQLIIYNAGSQMLKGNSGSNALFMGTVTSTGLIGNATNFDIRQNTSDGSDNKRTRIGGGGDVISSRGAMVEMSGNEHGNGGMLFLHAGNGGAYSQIRSYTAGTERMRIDSSGKLLIGSLASQTTDLLQVESPASGGGHGIAIRRNDANSDQQLGRIMFGNTADSDIGQIHVKTTGATNTGAMIFSTASAGTTAEAMRVQSDKIVVVTSGAAPIEPTIKHSGATGYLAKLRITNRSGQAPDKGGLLELGGVSDDGVSRSDIFGSIAGLKSTSGGSNREGYLQFSTSNGSSLAEAMRIDSSGRVGIANDTPGDFNAAGDDLVIGNSSGNRGITIRSGTSNSGNLFFADGLSGDQLYRGFIQYQHADDRLVLGTGGDDRVWISSSGNVGIGNATPSAPLDVVTNSNVYAAEFTQSNTSNGDGVFIQVGSTSSSEYVLTCRSNAGAVSALAVKADGKVGIGTFLPGYHLSVQGPTSDSGKITEFYGSRQDGALYVTNYLCGSDNDRVGLYWRNANVVNTRMWCDDTMDIRVHSGDPSSDTDGTVVGTQTFSGTHIYKTDATDLVVGQAVRLVGRKLVKTTSANDKLCVGIYAGQSGKVVDSFGQACNETDGYGHAVIALGDTRMKQSGTTTIGVLVDGSVEAGDLLCTSSTAGKLTAQADDIIRSYTVGKAIEDGNASAPVYAYIYCG